MKVGDIETHYLRAVCVGLSAAALATRRLRPSCALSRGKEKTACSAEKT